MQLSSEAICWIFNIANCVLILSLIIGLIAFLKANHRYEFISLVLGFISTAFLMWSGGLKEEFSNRDIKAANERAIMAEKTAIETTSKFQEMKSGFDIASENVSQAKEIASEATLKLRQVKSDFDIANKNLEQAQKVATEATLKLEKFRLPRTLNSEQQKNISLKLKPYAGTQFDFAVNLDPECQELLAQIETILLDAGWIGLEWKVDDDNPVKFTYHRDGKPEAGVISQNGLIIQMHKDKVQELLPRVKILGNELNAAGIKNIRVEFGSGFKNINTEAVHILIGKKL